MSVRVETAPEFRRALAAAGLDRPEVLLGRPGAGLVTRHARRATQLVPVPAGAGPPAGFYVKRWFRRPLLDALRDLSAFRRPRAPAAIERRALTRAAGAGVGVPPVAALAVERKMLLPGPCALVLPALGGLTPLDRLLAREWRRMGRSARNALIARTAEAVGRLHRAGLVHRDLYAKHLLAGEDGRVVFVDLTRLRYAPGGGLSRARARDLAALDASIPAGLVSRSDRLRWLRRYLGCPPGGKTPRRFCRLVLARSRRLAPRLARRRRPSR